MKESVCEDILGVVVVRDLRFGLRRGRGRGKWEEVRCKRGMAVGLRTGLRAVVGSRRGIVYLYIRQDGALLERIYTDDGVIYYQSM